VTKFEAEKDLYAQIAGGNEQAFNQFFLLHTDALLGYLLKITKSDIWAEELIQEVWVQFWTNRSHISQLENPLSYLYTIARNKAFDWIRKNKTELKWMMSNHFQAENPHQNLTEQQFSFKQLQEVVQSAVA
jgi:RNA polymerase sigma factor (sigma-70 family)